jgi:hypothetical protein
VAPGSRSDKVMHWSWAAIRFVAASGCFAIAVADQRLGVVVAAAGEDGSVADA